MKSQTIKPSASPRVLLFRLKPSTISTGSLHTSLCFHARPIKLVVYQGSVARKRACNHDLEGGFTLRCFQRLSLPYLATQRCT